MEKLYNNIVLPDNFRAEPSDARHIPYLEHPPEVIDVTVGRQLFVDGFLIEKTELTPEYHKAKKLENNPVLFPQTPWELTQSPVASPKSGGVWYDEKEQLFKMWYEAGWLQNMCYATSKDGLHWERPDLGIVPGTNQILPYVGYEPEKFCGDVSYLRPDSTTVFIDNDCEPAERYKLFLRNPGGKYPGIVAVSEDGVHFRDFRFTESIYDRSTIFYNPFRKKWVYSIRCIWDEGTDHGCRARNYRECDDFLSGAQWTEDEAKRWMSTDELDLPDPYIGFPPQLYNVDCVGYESIMLGLFQIMYGPENDRCEKRGVPKITELIPMYSRDGYHFSRPSRDSIISASRCKGAWDRGYVQSVGGVTVIHGDELWIYYVGFAGDENYRNQSLITNGMYHNGATGIAKLRRDGFVSMNGKGMLLTRKLTFTGKTSLHVNVDGSLKVEILDESGMLLAASVPVNCDCTDMALDFGNFDISRLNGKILRLRFCVEGKLYSFGFFDQNGESGGARAAGSVQK